MYRVLYINQSSWSELSDPLGFYVEAAKQIGLDEDQFRKDYTSDEVKQAINQDSDYAEKVGINQTPTFYVNGERYLGTRSIEDWQQAVDAALK